MTPKDRNENPTEVALVGPQQGAPEWLVVESEEDQSLDAMQQYRILPRLKLMQSMTDSKRKEAVGGEGTAVVTPGDMVVCERDGGFLAVPCFYFTEWLKQSHLEDKENPQFMDRSFEADSDLARRAKSKESRYEEYSDGRKDSDGKLMRFRYIEQHNFVMYLYGDHPMAGTPLTMGFSKGEYMKGTAFINACMARRVPLYGQVWSFSVGYRERPPKKWFGFDFSNPSEVSPWISKEELPYYKEQHLELAADFKKKRLIVDMSDQDPDSEDSLPAGSEDAI